MKVFSLGYGGKTPEEFVKILKDADVSLLVDVRWLPYCRWNKMFGGPGMSKMLKSNHIDYLHDRRLGNPTMELKSFAVTDNAKRTLSEIYNLAKSTGINVAFICSEKNHTNCHRNILCEWLEREHRLEVIHL